MKKIILLTLMFLSIISCKKKVEDNEDSCSSNGWAFVHIESLLSEFFFKEGSYWIYKNDSTNSLDSIAIVKTEKGCEAVYLYHGMGQNWDYYKISYHSYHSGSNFYDMIEGEVMMRNRHPSEYPAYQGWNIYSVPDTSISGWLPKILDSLTVENHTFYQVQFSHYLIPTDNEYLYVANNIGIIRKVVINSTGSNIWNLIRWKIVK